MQFMSDPIKAVARYAALLTVVTIALVLAPRVWAQNLFAPVISVGEDAITLFELEQRALFLTALRFPGDPDDEARDTLIDDRIRMRAVTLAGIEVTEDQVVNGINEFAARTNLTGDQFIAALSEEGIAPQTVRDFVRANIGWRELVRGLFLNQARPNEADIDKALARGSTGSVSVLLSEIIIPFNAQNRAQVDELIREISDIESYGEFETAARRYSAAGTRDQGGRLAWMGIDNLPATLRPIILALSPGKTTAPLELPNAMAVFQMRGIQEIVGPAIRYSAVDYAAYYIPGGRSDAALATARDIAGRVDNCDDLYGVAQGQPEQVLDRESVSPAALPSDFALELAKMDAGEYSTTLTRNNGQTLVFLMLCGRTAAPNATRTREEIGNQLLQERLTALADAYLAQLRANTLITEP